MLVRTLALAPRFYSHRKRKQNNPLGLNITISRLSNMIGTLRVPILHLEIHACREHNRAWLAEINPITTAARPVVTVKQIVDVSP